ncbi:MAG: replication initiation factor domain-containing protein [Oscillospiraceae bacterium]|nr:replication initiation factor domain-containing protein [Oscillospiraceae bacterium]
MEEWQDRRKQHGVSQKYLAERVGISVRHLRRIENGESSPPEHIRARIMAVLDELQALEVEHRHEAFVDYVRVHFRTKDIRRIVEEALRFPFADMLCEEWAFFGYDKLYRFGPIWVMLGDIYNKDRDVLLELRGEGCRTFERHLETLGWTWPDFFDHCLTNFPAQVKRLDLAIDDRDGLLSIPELIAKCRVGECHTRWIRKFSAYTSGMKVKDLVRGKHQIAGHTLYIGSFQSEIHICLYEKNYEQFRKHGVPLEDAPVKNRVEIRLKNDRAQNAAGILIVCRDVERVSRDILYTYLAFIDRVPPGSEVYYANKRWAKFLGTDREMVKLTNTPEPYSIERTKAWMRTCMPTIKLLLALDEMEGTNFVQESLANASFSARQASILKQVSAEMRT